MIHLRLLDETTVSLRVDQPQEVLLHDDTNGGKGDVESLSVNRWTQPKRLADTARGMVAGVTRRGTITLALSCLKAGNALPTSRREGVRPIRARIKR